MIEEISWAADIDQFRKAHLGDDGTEFYSSDRQCAVERYQVGKISPGYINVAVFGPNFWNKFVSQCFRAQRTFCHHRVRVLEQQGDV